MLVGHAHVVDRHPGEFQRLTLGRIDAADAKRADARRIDRNWQIWEIAVKAFLPAGVGERDAVQVAADRSVERVKVRVGIQPKHEERPAQLLGTTGHSGQRAGRDTVIAAEKDRHCFPACRIGSFCDRSGPRRDLRQRLQAAVLMRHGRKRSGRDRPRVLHFMAEFRQRLRESRGAQRARPHVAAHASGPVLDRSANDPTQHVAAPYCCSQRAGPAARHPTRTGIRASMRLKIHTSNPVRTMYVNASRSNGSYITNVS